MEQYQQTDKNQENEQTWQENVILVGISTDDNDDTQDSLAELEELLKTAGAGVVGMMIQNRESPHPGTYLGKGKIEELRELIEITEATGVVCDDELSPAQMQNLEELLDAKVMDRTMVILDIFAAHAVTNEGKIQVELAQLRYRLTRLSGMGRSMSRLGGGIGTRGPGEKKLEMDRRLIQNRITQLRKELADVCAHRETTRKQRERQEMPVVAIVGYTNAGKSTLLNALTGAGILAEDKLFATLDTTTRLLELPGKQQVLLTDTVGFIRKLPHHLVEAFRSTLEEAKYADYIIHVVDVSNPQMEKQMQVVYETLDSLGIRDKKIITLFNKTDMVSPELVVRDFRADKTIRISAKTEDGLDDVKDAIVDFLREEMVLVERIFPYEKMQITAQVRKQGELIAEEYRPEGVWMKAYVPRALYGQIDEILFDKD